MPVKLLAESRVSAGSRGTTTSGQAGPTACGSRSATSLPSGPRTLMVKPSSQPQPPQCHTRVLPAFVTRVRRVIGADGPPTPGAAVMANLTSVTTGRVGSFPQPDSTTSPAIRYKREKRRTFGPNALGELGHPVRATSVLLQSPAPPGFGSPAVQAASRDPA